MVSFQPESVYGARSAFHECVLITANEKSNPMWKSKFFKSGHVHGVTMLQRADMLKIPKDGYGSGEALHAISRATAGLVLINKAQQKHATM